MAMSLKATGAWATAVADVSVALVGTPAAGDRYFLWVAWKPYTVTCQVSGWTEIAEHADGTVAQGSGIGSMKIACYYRDWQSGDGNPTIDFSASPNIAGYVMQLWQCGAGEVWDTPTFAPGQRSATNVNSAFSCPSGVTVPSACVVMGGVALRDDSATFTRDFAGGTGKSGIWDNDGGYVTWNGNYVESPATHLSTATANQMSADLGYRFVTTGGSVPANFLGGWITSSAVETGVALLVFQTVSLAPATNTGAFFAMF